MFSYRGFKSHSILLLFKKARNGFEPLLKDLQSFTLPLCYLAKKKMSKKKRKFTYTNFIILTNGALFKINSIKHFFCYKLTFENNKLKNKKK